MSDIMAHLSQHAPVLTTLAITASVIVGLLSFYVTRQGQKRSHAAAAVNTLEQRIDKFRLSGGFAAIGDIVEDPDCARGCRFLSDSLVKSSAARTLTKLCNIARFVGDPEAWRRVLTPAEYEALREFLKRCSTLVWIVRTTSMRLQGEERFYNDDDKTNAGREIYEAMRSELHGIQPPQLGSRRNAA